MKINYWDYPAIYCIKNGLFKFFLWHEFCYKFHYTPTGLVTKTPTKKEIETIEIDLRIKMEHGTVPTPNYNKVSNYLMTCWKLSDETKKSLDELKWTETTYNNYYHESLLEYRKHIFFVCYLSALKHHINKDFVK